VSGTAAIYNHWTLVTVNNPFYRAEWIHSSCHCIISGKLNSTQNPELKSYCVQGKIVSSRYYTQVGLSAEGGELGFPALFQSRKEEKIISFFPCHFPHLLRGLVNKANMVHNFFYVYFFLYMFRATMCPASGETAVFMRHLVLVILYG
jgi:hypothetical protein